MKYNDRKKIFKYIVLFLMSFLLFYFASMPSRIMLQIYDVTDIRFSAVLNPTLSIAFGYPAIIGCTIANFVCDVRSGYGPLVSILGLFSQFLYGFIPYYIWKKKVVPIPMHRNRLDSPRLVISWVVVMAIDSIFIGICVGILQFLFTFEDFFTTVINTAIFVALNDFDVCVVLGLPIMAIIDYIYSEVIHKGKRHLSINEKIIIVNMLLQIVGVFIIGFYFQYNGRGRTLVEIWTDAYKVIFIFINVMLIISILVMFYFEKTKKEVKGLIVVKKKNGMIFVDKEKRLEFLTTPKSNDEREYNKNWYTMLSNQHGCPMKCQMCDCHVYGYFGNVKREYLVYQLETILNHVNCTYTQRYEIDFMRMGEPTFNHDILDFLRYDVKNIINSKVNVDIIYPYISTMLPKGNDKVKDYILEYCDIMNNVYDGNAGIQFSTNSTDDAVREVEFGGFSMMLKDIAKIGDAMPIPKGNKYFLNFPVCETSIIEPKVIADLFDKQKFAIKITPFHSTFNAVDNSYYSKNMYKYNDNSFYDHIVDEFKNIGFDVKIFMDSAAEDDDDLTCGNLLLPNM